MRICTYLYGMIRKTDKSANGTSFHDITIKTSLGRLRQAFGDPQAENNDGQDKTNIIMYWKLLTGMYSRFMIGNFIALLRRMRF